MSTITTINASDTITASRSVINTNFSNLNTDKIETSTLDTDTTLAANSDSKIATQKAVKTYVDAGGNVNASTTAKGIVEEATQAEVNAKTAAGATGARLFVNPSTVGAQFSTTQVFSGVMPTSFTDLNLSSVVGSMQRVVMLRFSGGDTNINIWTRRNGDTIDGSSLSPATTMVGINTIRITATANEGGYIICTTDTSGIIEWMASGANNCTINVEAYW